MLVLCAVISACSEAPSQAPLEPNYFPQSDSINRGGMGELSSEELETMRWLAWPQAYADMTSTFGLANRSTETKDIYVVEGSGQEVWVFYNGSQATGYEVRE